MKIKYYQNLSFELYPNEKLELVAKLRECAETCFSQVPDYQCIADSCDFENHVLTIAWENDKVIGFSSALELTDSDHNKFLHLGLTCVHADYRSLGLTHKLAGKLAFNYLIRNKPFGQVWFSNIAGVISSLANVGKSFDLVYPSPNLKFPTPKHLTIANTINNRYRHLVHISWEPYFDKEKFVFENSACEIFFKGKNNSRYHHRDKKLTNFYLNWLNLDNGDEMIQVGYFSIFTFLRYMLGCNK